MEFLSTKLSSCNISSSVQPLSLFSGIINMDKITGSLKVELCKILNINFSRKVSEKYLQAEGLNHFPP